MGKRGFTLIELLIVIAIVAILAGAMVPLINVSRQEARAAKASSETDSIKTSSMMLFYDTGEWPTTGSVGGDLIADSSSYAGWAGPYIDAWEDDPWGSAYIIYDSGATQRWARSLGADNAVGGAGWNEDIEVILTPSW